MTDKTKNTAHPETADIETSSDGYARRFEGATGKWFLGKQADIVLSMLKGMKNPSVLDVGGGHGQLAIPLCERGFKVTVLGSDETCSRRIEKAVAGGNCSFKTGSMTDIPFPDRSFDIVLCFRLLPHCTQWERLIGELCRTAANAVIADYPAKCSLNGFAPLLFKTKRRIETNTREWTSFSHSAIGGQFRKNGFDISARRGQFFMPMVMHRVLKTPAVSACMEGVCRVCGLTALFGSPVIIKAVRNGEK